MEKQMVIAYIGNGKSGQPLSHPVCADQEG